MPPDFIDPDWDGSVAGPDMPEQPARPLPRAAGIAPFGIIGSVAVHLLPIALLLGWHGRPVEAPAPIPVRLVLEQAKPEPTEKATPASRRASEDIGEKVPKSGQSSDTPSPPAAPAETKTAAIVPPHPPMPPAPATEPERAPEPPSPAPPSKADAAPIPPPPEKPAVPVRRAALRPASKPAKPLPPPRPAERLPSSHPVRSAARELPHAGEVSGPAAVRDAYLAELRVLTLRYLRTVPPGFIGSRRGNMALLIRVLGDGTIARIAVASGSGYPDIDSRFEQIIGAMAHFPPLPPSYPGDAVDLTLRLRFPDALEE